MKIHTIDLEFKNQKSGIASFLVESPDGPIIVETGPHSTLPRLKEQLLQLGYQMSDIHHVFVTHIHLDHAGAAWCFAEAGANIYLHPFGFRHMHDPSRLLSSAKRIYGDEMDTLWGTLKPIPESQLFQIEDRGEVNLGKTIFRAWHTPGHAKHHIAWQLDNNLFTGDVMGVCIHHGPVIPPCPPPDINLEQWKSSINLLAGLGDVGTYYLTHFGAVTDLPDHRRHLVEALDTYASFFKPYAEAGVEVDQILPEFREFVRSFLVQQGMNFNDAAAYEAANPSDMSATGLMRYWQKKLQTD